MNKKDWSQAISDYWKLDSRSADITKRLAEGYEAKRINGFVISLLRVGVVITPILFFGLLVYQDVGTVDSKEHLWDFKPKVQERVDNKPKSEVKKTEVEILESFVNRPQKEITSDFEYYDIQKIQKWIISNPNYRFVYEPIDLSMYKPKCQVINIGLGRAYIGCGIKQCIILK